MGIKYYILMKGFIVATLVALTIGAIALNQYSNESVETTGDRFAQIAEKVNSMNSTWKAGVNTRFANMSTEAIQSSMMKIDYVENKKTTNQYFHSYAKVASAPASFDSRTEWSKCESISEVRDQSSCGSCWAFGAAEVMSDRICIHSGQTNQTRVSTTDLLSCCEECGDGCQGGFPPSAFDYWMNSGVVSGDLYQDTKFCLNYPFAPCAHHVPAGKYPACPGGENPTPKCTRTCTNGDDFVKSKTYGRSSYTVSGESQIMAEISTNGPVEGSFTVYADFPTYKSGVYQHLTGEALGGHAIRMIGYGEENGTKYWIVANSWNEPWGDHGYFKILRGENHCGMESGAAAGMPRL